MKLSIPYAPTGDPGFIAYTSNRGGQYDIWVYNPRTGESKPLTNGLGDAFSEPIWSPDSSRIAFVGKNRIVYVIYAATGLTAGIDQLEEGGDFRLDWSPDSSSLAYVARRMIILYNATLHEAESFMQPGASDVSWFPSGTELLFQALDESGISQLFRIGTNGTAKKQITRNTNGPLHDARLSPDGRFALYTTPGASVSIIYTVELATGTVHEVKGGPIGKTISRNGLPILYGLHIVQLHLMIEATFRKLELWNGKGQRIGYGRFRIVFLHQSLGRLTEGKLHISLGVMGRNLPMKCGSLIYFILYPFDSLKG